MKWTKINQNLYQFDCWLDVKREEIAKYVQKYKNKEGKIDRKVDSKDNNIYHFLVTQQFALLSSDANILWLQLCVYILKIKARYMPLTSALHKESHTRFFIIDYFSMFVKSSFQCERGIIGKGRALIELIWQQGLLSKLLMKLGWKLIVTVILHWNASEINSKWCPRVTKVLLLKLCTTCKLQLDWISTAA